MASAAGQFKGRDEFRKAQELEEARKAGLAPAALDEECVCLGTGRVG